MAPDKLAELADAGIARVRVHYSDLLGTTRAKVVPLELLDDLVDGGLRFCVSVFSIDHTGVMPDGTGLRDEVTFRDMEVIPDLSTLRVVPWERETAICLGDCYFDGSPFAAAPRGILRRAIAEAEKRGLRAKCAHELEFFLLRRTREGRFEPYVDMPGLVYRLDPRVDPQGVVRAMEDGVRGLGVNVVAANQEYDPSQWEINCKYDDALKAADDAHLLKLAVKEIASMHGLTATFMGRCVDGGGTSGYHIHVSLWDEERHNLMEDASDPHGVSALARAFVGGQLAHGRGMTAVLAPTVNAYKRFRAKELAPYWIDWALDNRSAYVRVPGDRGRSTRVECRGADGAANPYLAAALVIFAGLDGIERELDPGPPTAGAYEPVGEREMIPFSLEEALDALEADAFLRGKLGDQFLQAFTTIKRNEARRFSLAVTDWELREYADAL
jgi:glutamine synthetase